MSVHIVEATVDLSGRVVLEHLPFHPGDKVDVVLRSRDEHVTTAHDLTGSVLRYDNPFDPIAEEDWEANH
jgi:hypothetical protein